MNCCGSYIEGEKKASTPEVLMRSRYTAYTKGEIEYIYVAPLFRGQGVAKKLLKLTKKRVGKELIPQQPISPLGKKLFNIV